ncbi:thymidylate kinase-domain-containing protein [Xylogone sp. PMI_703]|nr:thymidylate kinase-domain-containing protein [Xylogone sp. PMI_703]
MASNQDQDRPWQQPTTPITRGAFIVVEGLDRAGKTTQVRALADELYSSGRNVKAIRFPERTSPIGQMINNYLQSKTEMDDHVIHLLFSANRWEFSKFISENTTKGYTIICDRYYYSGIVYSAAKQNPSLSLTWAHEPEVGLPRPDIVVFLDLDSEEAEKRGGYGDEKYEKKEMQKRVRELFLDLPLLGTDESEDIEVINAGGSIEEVAKEIKGRVLQKVKEVEEGRLGNELRIVRAWPDGVLDELDKSKKR